jgi:transcriptional regulator with XRE-family HTH domain
MKMRKDRLKESRQKSHLTQDELAEKLHTVKTQISRWERGESMPHAKILIQLSQILNVSVDYLLGISDEPTIRVRVDNLSMEEMAVISAMRSGNDQEALKIIVNREKRPPTAV